MKVIWSRRNTRAEQDGVGGGGGGKGGEGRELVRG